MVVNAANSYNLATCRVYQLTYIAMHAFNVLLPDGWARGLDMEYQVYVYFAQ